MTDNSFEMMPPQPTVIASLDHLVLTVQDMERTVQFYVQTLGMTAVTFGEGRRAVQFGQQKINLHQASAPVAPHAAIPTPGSADLCFLTATPISHVIFHLGQLEIPVEQGPVIRTGATGTLLSIYIRDPDRNLIEISNLQPAA